VVPVLFVQPDPNGGLLNTGHMFVRGGPGSATTTEEKGPLGPVTIVSVEFVMHDGLASACPTNILTNIPMTDTRITFFTLYLFFVFLLGIPT
jgi:hypothetical protein